MNWGEGQQGQMPGSLDCRRQLALVTRADARLSLGFDFRPVRKIAPEPLDIFIVDNGNMFGTKGANLSPRNIPSPARTACCGFASSTEPT